ncbi:hypothetical protein KSS87_017742 [Heliosperma pusillum]|nr:hypothetical protein KSS87_017742 [Heliosperma pusillum]
MPKIMKIGKQQRYKSEEEEEFDEDDFEDEEEEEEEEDEFDDEDFEKNVIENFDPNTITVKLQKSANIMECWKFMKINREIELKWLMFHYCDTMGIEYRNTKFMFNGACVRSNDTPLQLSMVNGDIIYVLRSNNQGVYTHSPILYETLCIRDHKRKDTFVRVTPNEPLLRQIKRNFSDGGYGKHGTTSFFYKGQKLQDTHTTSSLRTEDGDIIDAFNFENNRSSLSFTSAMQIPIFKGNPGINKNGPRINVSGTPGTRNPPLQQQTRPRPPPYVMHGRPYPGTK